MDEDLAALLALGGRVIDAKDIRRAYSIHLTRYIAENDWNFQLRQRYISELMRRGWAPAAPPDPDIQLLFCKRGVELAAGPETKPVRSGRVSMSWGSAAQFCPLPPTHQR
jgi:hypothetical protein